MKWFGFIQNELEMKTIFIEMNTYQHMDCNHMFLPFCYNSNYFVRSNIVDIIGAGGGGGGSSDDVFVVTLLASLSFWPTIQAIVAFGYHREILKKLQAYIQSTTIYV